MKLDDQGRIIEGELGLLGTTKASYSIPLAIPSVFWKFQIEGSLESKFTFKNFSGGSSTALQNFSRSVARTLLSPFNIIEKIDLETHLFQHN